MLQKHYVPVHSNLNQDIEVHNKFLYTYEWYYENQTYIFVQVVSTDWENADKIANDTVFHKRLNNVDASDLRMKIEPLAVKEDTECGLYLYEWGFW